MDRGLLLAHRELWEHHVRGHCRSEQRRKLAEADDVLVIFEDDPCVPTPLLHYHIATPLPHCYYS